MPAAFTRMLYSVLLCSSRGLLVKERNLAKDPRKEARVAWCRSENGKSIARKPSDARVLNWICGGVPPNSLVQ